MSELFFETIYNCTGRCLFAGVKKDPRIRAPIFDKTEFLVSVTHSLIKSPAFK